KERILTLRHDLLARGLYAGADTIGWHLAREHITISRATIWRILTAAGQVTAQPQKRPRSSWRRFAAERPNQMWQSDFTHALLDDGTEVEIIGWLDDHSRFLTHLTAQQRVTGGIVTDTFTQAAAAHGYPTSTLTDNGMVYTTRYARGGRGLPEGTGNAFETLLALHGITQKNGKPYKPTTQGKTERFWQTLNKHLATPPARDLHALQATLDGFRAYYHHHRPQQGGNRQTPADAYHLLPKATPPPPDDPDLWRVRYDIVDHDGKISLRHSGRMLHLGIGRAHARTEIICLVHNDHATVINANTGEVLTEHTLEATRTYQRKNG